MQSDSYFICDKTTGQVLYKGQQGEESLMLGDNKVKVDCHSNTQDPADYYYDTQTGQVKKKHIFADGELIGDMYTISLPIGTEVSWQGESYLVDDGELSVLIDQKGIFNLWLTHPLYQFEVKKIENQ